MAKASERKGETRRRRGPRRSGHRTTLTVPDDLMKAARDLAEEVDTSTNDAIVRLARMGAQRYVAESEIAQRAARRQAAILALDEGPGEGPELTPEEFREAALLMRTEEW